VSPAAKAQAPMLARSQSPKAEAESRFNTEAHCPAAAPSISGIQSRWATVPNDEMQCNKFRAQ
ncbi:MAG: hypothetical protein WB993_00805, partial [Candidatus Sulfotelmatobacter sp.]